MSDDALMEEPVQFGEASRLFGILTVPNAPPGKAPELPVFVFLSAGLLHRVGPYRLHVRLARELAGMGFPSLRVDLAGMGDSPPRAGLTTQQSVAEDFAEIMGLVDARLGRRPIVLAGLCIGADNATNLTLKEPRVVGMVLLDPICFPDRGYRARAILAKYTNPARYIGWLRRHLRTLAASRRLPSKQDRSIDPLALRYASTPEQLAATFEAVRVREGQVLSVFTSYALHYYNQAGQLGRALGIKDYSQFCSELFWPWARHTYATETHRRRLIEEIKNWASAYVRREEPAAGRHSPVITLLRRSGFQAALPKLRVHLPRFRTIEARVSTWFNNGRKAIHDADRSDGT